MSTNQSLSHEQKEFIGNFVQDYIHRPVADLYNKALKASEEKQKLNLKLLHTTAEKVSEALSHAAEDPDFKTNAEIILSFSDIEREKIVTAFKPFWNGNEKIYTAFESACLNFISHIEDKIHEELKKYDTYFGSLPPGEELTVPNQSSGLKTFLIERSTQEIRDPAPNFSKVLDIMEFIIKDASKNEHFLTEAKETIHDLEKLKEPETLDSIIPAGTADKEKHVQFIDDVAALIQAAMAKKQITTADSAISKNAHIFLSEEERSSTDNSSTDSHETKSP